MFQLYSLGVVLLSWLATLSGSRAASIFGEAHHLPRMDGRIVGGSLTTINTFPWQVSLQRKTAHSCGGAIYSEDIIVTAAHCLQAVSPTILRVRAGSSFWNSGGMLVEVADFIAHEDYSPENMRNDIAVIQLAQPLTLSDTVQAISLATQPPPHGAPAVVSGWGATAFGSYLLPVQLMNVNLTIVDRDRCASSAYGYGPEIKASMLCATAIGKDACQGDSGGPLVSGGKLVGVVSWGYGCAYPNYPGVYSDVAALHSWLMDTIAKLKSKNSAHL